MGHDEAEQGRCGCSQTTHTLPGVQAFDVELLRRQVLHSVQVGDGDYGPALTRLRYLAARYGPPEIAALAQPDELPLPRLNRQE
jgi:hypothetical protein